jgi:hypothetical protein
VGEQMAHYFNPAFGTPFVGLRCSDVRTGANYGRLARLQEDARLWCWNAWEYVDARGAAQSSASPLT